MQISDLKNVVGTVAEGEVAKIKFFGHINEAMTTQFNNEFEFLETVVKPSRIDILINSEGGSVLHGMSSFAVIQNSSVKTRCINEGLAASMASVILVAGDETYMRDYSVIMIHQPFIPDNKDGEIPPAVKAFSNQLETIYHKRFGIPKERVKAIMDGKAGEDGTYFDANEAVRAGIIPASNVITTKQLLPADVHAMIKDPSSVEALQKYFDKVASEVVDDFKPIEDENTIHIQETTSTEENKTNQNTENMPEQKPEATTVGFIEASIATQLGMTSFDAGSVSARLSELVGIEASYKTLQTEHNNLKTELEGKVQAVQNLTDNLASVQSQLDTYRQKEAEVKKAEIVAFVNELAEQGKIQNIEGEINKWIERAEANFDLVKDVMASIPARDKISEEIKNDPANVEAAANGAKTEVDKLQEKVEAVVGKDFTFIKANE